MSLIPIDTVRKLEALMLEEEQIDIQVEHTLHAGVYTRTVMIPKGVTITGAHIVIPTTVVLSGDASVFTGEDVVRFQGYHVLTAQAGRKSIFVAHKDTYLTMLFHTNAKGILEAENEFTDEAHMLQSRTHKGDQLCLESQPPQ